MNPEEKKLLEKALELSTENNRILHKLQRVARWARVWGLIKLLIIVVPLVIGYLYLEPQVKVLLDSVDALKNTVPALNTVL